MPKQNHPIELLDCLLMQKILIEHHRKSSTNVPLVLPVDICMTHDMAYKLAAPNTYPYFLVTCTYIYKSNYEDAFNSNQFDVCHAVIRIKTMQHEPEVIALNNLQDFSFSDKELLDLRNTILKEWPKAIKQFLQPKYPVVPNTHLN